MPGVTRMINLEADMKIIGRAHQMKENLCLSEDSQDLHQHVSDEKSGQEVSLIAVVQREAINARRTPALSADG